MNVSTYIERERLLAGKAQRLGRNARILEYMRIANIAFAYNDMSDRDIRSFCEAAMVPPVAANAIHPLMNRLMRSTLFAGQDFNDKSVSTKCGQYTKVAAILLVRLISTEREAVRFLRKPRGPYNKRGVQGVCAALDEKGNERRLTRKPHSPALKRVDMPPRERMTTEEALMFLSTKYKDKQPAGYCVFHDGEPPLTKVGGMSVLVITSDLSGCKIQLDVTGLLPPDFWPEIAEAMAGFNKKQAAAA